MYIIWHDKDYDLARWVYLNSDLLKTKERTLLRPIPKTNAKNTILSVFEDKTDYHILPVIKYDTPDIIIQHIDEPKDTSRIIFVTEFMTHTPQHHHPLQRFPRIYGASKLMIPVALVLPRSKTKLERKNGIYKPVSYKTNPLIYHIFLRTTKINKNPTLIFLWPEEGGYLKYDKKHQTAPFIDEQIERWFYFLNKYLGNPEYDYTRDKEIMKQKKTMIEISNYQNLSQTELIKEWKQLYKLKTIRIIKTGKAIKEFRLDVGKLTKEFIDNEFTLIFEPKGLHSPSTPFRTDPYAGMLCAFDNLFCRDEEGNRTVNVILRAENINYRKVSFREIKHDTKNCPFISIENAQKISLEEVKEHLDNCAFTSSKQQRIYGDIADIIIFDDYICYKEDENDRRI